MRILLSCLAINVSLCASLRASPAMAVEKPQPVRMGCGRMTFDTVPGWGLRPDGHSALGPTHGSVVVDKAGKIRMRFPGPVTEEVWSRKFVPLIAKLRSEQG